MLYAVLNIMIYVLDLLNLCYIE